MRGFIEKSVCIKSTSLQTTDINQKVYSKSMTILFGSRSMHNITLSLELMRYKYWKRVPSDGLLEFYATFCYFVSSDHLKHAQRYHFPPVKTHKCIVNTFKHINKSERRKKISDFSFNSLITTLYRNLTLKTLEIKLNLTFQFFFLHHFALSSFNIPQLD